MKQTSLDAYENVNLGLNQTFVLNTIKKFNYPLSDRNIANHLGWTINRVTGRRNELVKLGLIESAGTQKNEFNRSVHTWKLKK